MKIRAVEFAGAFLAALWVAAGPASAQQRPGSFYDVDREIKIEGPVRDVRLEPRYENTQPFLVVRIEDKTTGRTYSVEISPVWFFDQDIHQGEKLKVVGSLVSREASDSVLMAREVQCRGETIRVRDRNGFPNWRGGPGPFGKRKRGPGY